MGVILMTTMEQTYAKERRHPSPSQSCITRAFALPRFSDTRDRTPTLGVADSCVYTTIDVCRFQVES